MRPSAPPTIFHLTPRPFWEEALGRGVYRGRGDDLKDGFIHCSSAAQVEASAARHCAGQADLLLLTLAPARLGPALRWEAAKNGELFPHIYGALPIGSVLRSEPLPLGPDGRHRFPDWVRTLARSR